MDWLAGNQFHNFLLRPYHENFGKQLVKSPKLYFYDTGVVCSLLDIQAESQLNTHYLRGGLFENFIIAELAKSYYNRGLQPQLFFWRDKNGHEIDCLLKQADKVFPIEIKSGQTISQDFFANLHYWQSLTGISPKQCSLIYGGEQSQSRNVAEVYSWRDFVMNGLKEEIF